MKGRDWLAMMGRPIVKGDPINDMEIIDAKASRDGDQYMLRLPDGMRDKIKELADKNQRSMNSEIVSALRQALEQPSRIERIEITLQAMIDQLEAQGSMRRRGLEIRIEDIIDERKTKTK